MLSRHPVWAKMLFLVKKFVHVRNSAESTYESLTLRYYPCIQLNERHTNIIQFGNSRETVYVKFSRWQIIDNCSSYIQNHIWSDLNISWILLIWHKFCSSTLWFLLFKSSQRIDTGLIPGIEMNFLKKQVQKAFESITSDDGQDRCSTSSGGENQVVNKYENCFEFS